MKRRVAVIVLMLIFLLTGCKRIVEPDTSKPVVYASFTPIYLLTNMLLSGIDDISLAQATQPTDSCLRAYELSEWDLYSMAYNADAVVIGGRGLESFSDTLYSLGDDGPAVITSMYGLNLYNESDKSEITEDSSHLTGANPYLYMSVLGAQKMVNVIAEGLMELYLEISDEIQINVDSANVELSKLYSDMQVLLENIRGKDVIIMNEALVYTAVECGLTVSYWFDREPTTTLYGESLENTLDEMKSSGANVVLIEKQAPMDLVNAIEEAGFSVALIDTMTGSVNSYIDAQKSNCQNIMYAFESVNGGSFGKVD